MGKGKLVCLLLTISCFCLVGCHGSNNLRDKQDDNEVYITKETEAVEESETKQESEMKQNAESDVVIGEIRADGQPQKIGEMSLQYATQFHVTYYEDGYAGIEVEDGNCYVLVPEGGQEYTLNMAEPAFIHIPSNRIYLAASSAMDLFRELDGLDNICACSTKAQDYASETVNIKIEQGDIVYVGKYSAPDYEQLLQLNTNLAIESTMIYHSPKIKEELEQFEIPVLVERSSYEENPLGRLEWIKLYGLLIGKEKEAERIYGAQVEQVNAVVNALRADDLTNVDSELNADGTKKEYTQSASDAPGVAFFYISSNGYVNVRKPGDYVSRMIEMAGGRYIFDSLQAEENALSTVNISWEDFYMYAKDADILIYNGTIDGGIDSVESLIYENEMFADFKAVQEKRVYCSNNNMYQETSKMGDIIVELAKVIRGEQAANQYIRLVR